MIDLDSLLFELDERQIASRLSKHDEARLRYHLQANTVSDNQEYHRVIADYWRHQFGWGYRKKSRIPELAAMVQATMVLDTYCQRSGRTPRELMWNAIEGTNGGIRTILDIMCEELKAHSRRSYIQEVVDKHVDPIDHKAKVDAVRQLFLRCANFLPRWVNPREPKVYAMNYRELILAYAESRSALLIQLESG